MTEFIGQSAYFAKYFGLGGTFCRFGQCPAAWAYCSQPRFLKYHMGTTALAAISPSAYG